MECFTRCKSSSLCSEYNLGRKYNCRSRTWAKHHSHCQHWWALGNNLCWWHWWIYLQISLLPSRTRLRSTEKCRSETSWTHRDWIWTLSSFVEYDAMRRKCRIIPRMYVRSNGLWKLSIWKRPSSLLWSWSNFRPVDLFKMTHLKLNQYRILDCKLLQSVILKTHLILLIKINQL